MRKNTHWNPIILFGGGGGGGGGHSQHMHLANMPIFHFIFIRLLHSLTLVHSLTHSLLVCAVGVVVRLRNGPISLLPFSSCHNSRSCLIRNRHTIQRHIKLSLSHTLSSYWLRFIFFPMFCLPLLLVSLMVHSFIVVVEVSFILLLQQSQIQPTMTIDTTWPKKDAYNTCT